MSDKKSVRLNKLVKEFNVSIDRIYSFLETKGIEDLKPNSKVSHDIYMDLLGEFDSEKKAKLSAELLAKEKELVKAEEIIKQQETEDAAQKVAEAKEQAKIAAQAGADWVVTGTLTEDASSLDELRQRITDIVRAIQ